MLFYFQDLYKDDFQDNCTFNPQTHFSVIYSIPECLWIENFLVWQTRNPQLSCVPPALRCWSQEYSSPSSLKAFIRLIALSVEEAKRGQWRGRKRSGVWLGGRHCRGGEGEHRDRGDMAGRRTGWKETRAQGLTSIKINTTTAIFHCCSLGRGILIRFY